MISEPETRLCVKQKEAARLLDISVDHFVTLGIRPTLVGKTMRYRVRSLQAYLDRQDGSSAEKDLVRHSR